MTSPDPHQQYLDTLTRLGGSGGNVSFGWMSGRGEVRLYIRSHIEHDKLEFQTSEME
jgi:hypothetical protein